MSWYETFLVTGTAIPLVSFVLLAFFGPRLGKPAAGWVAVLAMATSCVLSGAVLFGWLAQDDAGRAALTAAAAQHQFHWADLGDVAVRVGVKLDSLTVIMFFMVTFIATNIFIFSVGYMAGHSDEVDGRSKYHRFFTYLSLFGFSMLGLVISSNLLFLFIFWELVGLCSYLLIGFYFDKKFASDAAMKAFITNRVGDFGFLFGLMMVFTALGTLDLTDAAAEFARQYHTNSGIFASTINLFGWHISGANLATAMGIGLFCGAMGKSAQFPLHVWLPDAMAGPTPVSALIHAATMVAAGVYLVARVYMLLTPDALYFIAAIGVITLTITALIAVVQTDIKKVLAYSTLSQLGYMIFGLGMGAWIAALFHLMTHAFFKAMLFLGSGQVIEGCHHEQEITKMGGLRKKMPFTCWTFFIGVLAIAGTGIPGIGVGLGGYYSKDEILAVARMRTNYWPPTGDHGHGGGHDNGEHGNHGHDADHSSISGRKSDGLGATPNPRFVLASFQQSDADPDSEVQALPTLDSSIQLPRQGTAPQFDSTLPGQEQTHRPDVIGEPQPDGQLTELSPPVATDHNQIAHVSGTASPHQVDQDHLLGIAASLPTMPGWMFWLPIVIAYVTPFYMMRCWWLTFMGTPRDEHVYEHAHESKLMFIPLVVLAVGTFYCSWWMFRDQIANAAPSATNASMIVAIDGHADDASHAAGLLLDHHAHTDLIWIVGFAFLIGFGIAWAIYRNGLELARSISQLPVVSFVHSALVNKLYFDHVYNFFLVGGCKVVAFASSAFDGWVVDNVYNLSAKVTERIAALSGKVFDRYGVDGIFNGMASMSKEFADMVRTPQTGRIRNYVLFTTGAAALVLIVLLAGASVLHAVVGWIPG